MASRPRRDSARRRDAVGQQVERDGSAPPAPHASVPDAGRAPDAGGDSPRRTKRRTVGAWPGTTGTATAGVPSAHAS